MKNKIWLCLCFLILSAASFAQNGNYPNVHTQSNEKTFEQWSRSRTSVDSLAALRAFLVSGWFVDTVQANQHPYISSVPDVYISTGQFFFWRRSHDATKWILQTGGLTDGCLSRNLIDGTATYSGVGLTYDVSLTHYTFPCDRYFSTPPQQVTADGADNSYPRTDVIYVDTLNHVGILKGTPGTDPLKPQVDPRSQIELTHIDILPGHTTPENVDFNMIYNENLEPWGLSSNISSINPIDVSIAPYFGAVSTLIVNPVSGQFFSYTYGNDRDIREVPFLKLAVRLNSAPANPSRVSMTISFYKDNVEITSRFSITNGMYGFNSSLVGTWQVLALPIYSLSYIQTNYNRVNILLSNFPASSSFDKIYLLDGVPPVTANGTPWLLGGNFNNGIIPNTIGTRDKSDWPVITNDILRFIISADGIQEDSTSDLKMWVYDPYSVNPIIKWRWMDSFALHYPMYVVKNGHIKNGFIDTSSSNPNALVNYAYLAAHSGGGATTQFNWVEQFDDGIIGANQTNGINKSFTISHTPLDSLVVFKNGLRMKKGQNYTYNGTTGITFIDTVLKKDFIVATYNYSSVQPVTNRYAQSATVNVVGYGNSIFYGVKSVNGFSDPIKQLSLFTPTVGFHYANVSVPGAITTQLTARINDSLLPKLSLLYALNIVLVHEITNDIANGANATTAYNNYVALCNAIKTAFPSVKIIACTVLPGSPYVNEAIRITVNANIVANYLTFADGLADFSTNSNIGDPGDNMNQIYYASDSLHLRPEGSYQIASTLYPPVMVQAGIATQNITRVILPQDDKYVINGDSLNRVNYTDTSKKKMLIGTTRPIGIGFATDDIERGGINRRGQWIIDPIINATTGDTTFGVKLNPTITGNNSGATYDAVQIAGKFSNSFTSTYNQLRVKDNLDSTILVIANNKSLSGLGTLHQIIAPTGNYTGSAFTVNSSLSLSNFITGGISWSGANGYNTGNGTVIGFNTDKLIYNTNINYSHSFRSANTERFGIGFNNQIYGGYGANLSATNAFNVGSNTTGGFILTSPGGQPNQIHMEGSGRFQAYEAPSTGGHRFYAGNAGLTLEVNSTGLKVPILPASANADDSMLVRRQSDGVVGYRAIPSAGGGGTVTSVSGTANRVTSTGGATPVIDISATFEALLGKVANPLSQFTATTSSQLAGVISDETGTAGSLVFSVSPALTGTPLSPTAIAGTNTTQIATTAFVTSAVSTAGSGYVPYTGATSDVVLGAHDISSLTHTFGQTASPIYSRGRLFYDTGTESLTFFNNDANVGLQIGQEEWIKVVNNTGSSIANGSAVYLNGASGGVPTIALAQANAGTTTIGAGLTTETIANGATGYVTSIGIVNGLNTSGFTAGQVVYIDAATPGALTSTAPTAPNFRYRVGIVGVSSATVGTIHVTPSTASLGNGTANQVFGMNTAGTAQEMKSLLGTTNRLTATNATNSITFDISATFEALLGKVANRIDQNNAATTSAQFFSIISDETGTGSVVGSASPVGTGTWTIPTIAGGSTTTSPLILYATTGVAAAGASVIFKGGTNGGTTFTTMSSVGNWDFGAGNLVTTGTATFGTTSVFNLVGSGNVRGVTGTIGTGSNAPVASSIFDVASTTKGTRPFPPMTSAQRLAIPSPAVGLMVYQTDGTEGAYLFKSGGWGFAF